jgi:hypothetical protein
VEKGISADLYLTRTLRHASLIRTSGLRAEEILRRVDAREMDAWAANKQRLAEMISGAGGFRILPDSFLAIGQSMVSRAFENFDVISVSAGIRGCQLVLAPDDLVRIAGGSYRAIS